MNNIGLSTKDNSCCCWFLMLCNHRSRKTELDPFLLEEKLYCGCLLHGKVCGQDKLVPELILCTYYGLGIDFFPPHITDTGDRTGIIFEIYRGTHCRRTVGNSNSLYTCKFQNRIKKSDGKLRQCATLWWIVCASVSRTFMWKMVFPLQLNSSTICCSKTYSELLYTKFNLPSSVTDKRLSRHGNKGPKRKFIEQ